jgi:hypothetical protein
MKNIHILPTDKPSRLHLIEDVLTFTNKYKTSVCDSEVNIYITSDEEIKEGDWCLDIKRNIIFQSKRNEIGTSKKIPIIICTYEGCYIKKDCKKIILTTDQDLIKDGVQEIPEYFLIHYIVGNNPIEYVEIKEHLESLDTMKINYEIIIPKEEPTLANMKCTCINFHINCFSGMCRICGLPPKEELCPLCNDNELIDGVCKECTELLCKPFSVLENHETLEEAAERLYPIILEDDGWDKNKQYRDEWTKGAKWQQKNSEEEVIQLVSDWTDYRMSEDSKSKVTFKKWFKQFKK